MEVSFERKTFVVLGHLTTMTKREAWLKIQSLGGYTSNTPRPSSNYFIQGERVPAARQARAEELGFPILSEQEFIDAVEAARAEAAATEEHVELGDAIASFRGLFDGTPSRAIWKKVIELLDECPPEQLPDACQYVESYVSRWPDHRDSPSAPSMRGQQTYRHDPPSDDPTFDLRVAMRTWLRELLEGMESPKFSLIRQIGLDDMNLNGKTMTHLVRNPTLTRVRELDVGHGNSITQSFYKALRTSEHLLSLDTLTLTTMSEKHAKALYGDHTLSGLRWVRLATPEKLAVDAFTDAYAPLFEAGWWSGVEGLDLSVSRRLWGLRAASLYGLISEHASNLPALRHLILGDTTGIEDLYGSPLLDQLTRLTVFTSNSEGFVGLLQHLDENPDHSIRVLDLSRSNYAHRGDKESMENRRAYFETLSAMKHLDVCDESALPRPHGTTDRPEELEPLAADAGVTLSRSPFPK